MAPRASDDYGIVSIGWPKPPDVVTKTTSETDLDPLDEVSVTSYPARDKGVAVFTEWVPSSSSETFDQDVLLPLCVGWYLLAGLVVVALYYVHLRIRFGPLLQVGCLASCLCKIFWVLIFFSSSRFV